VDAHQPGPFWAEVSKAVRGIGWPGDDVAGSAFDGFIADPDQDATLEDDEGLVVGMGVNPVCVSDRVVSCRIMGDQRPN
jgi:hypothetical protein